MESIPGGNVVVATLEFSLSKFVGDSSGLAVGRGVEGNKMNTQKRARRLGSFGVAFFLLAYPAAGLCWQMDTSLATADASFHGEAEGDYSGGPVSGIGDVDGDGFDDILIGAIRNDEVGSLAGQAYLVFGDPSLSPDMSLAAAGASFLAEAAGDYAGVAVGGGGDFNGDGYEDFLIGASLNDEAFTDAGQAYLFFGGPGGWAMDTSLAMADASFLGEAAYDYAGISVENAGDVNADGFDDLVIGAEENSESAPSAGQAYLIFGKPSGWSVDVGLASSDASFLGEEEDDRAGFAVAGAGDVNGDSMADLLVGAYRNDDGGQYAGQTYLVFGRPSGWAMDTSLSASDASFVGEGNGFDQSGISVAGAGDVDGDGFDDFLIGASGNEDAGWYAGQTYLIFGAASGWSMDTSLALAGASYLGESTSDYSGRSVAGLGDTNGDGYDDFLVGAYGNEDAGSYAGQTYLVFGRPSGWSMDTDLGVSDASFLGEGEHEYSGWSVAGPGDVDGDGYDDVLIGACTSDEAGEDAGQTYLVLGGEHPCIDLDGDGYGNPGDAACPGGADEDCDDADPAIHPGIAEVACDFIDNNCDGVVHPDEFDWDGDGYTVCEGDIEFDPNDPPHGMEVPCDYIDNNGDGVLHPHEVDDDGDGFDECGPDLIEESGDEDCDDGDAAVYPGAAEVACDFIDNDCDGDLHAQEVDDDADGFTECDGDCDDGDDAINPGAAEVACDFIDNDCDGNLHAWEVDDDADGFTECDGDCGDWDDSIFPGRFDTCNHGDDDCDGLIDEDAPVYSWYPDADGDGHGDPHALPLQDCMAIADHVTVADDCDDGDATTYPGADEYCDGVDNDCDGATDEDDAVDALTWYLDLDGDGFGDPGTTDIDCDQPGSFVGNDEDCDDFDFYVHPGAEEVCNGLDDDCDPATDEHADDDGDGFTLCDGDCDVHDPDVNPDAIEECDGIDNDCDETTDEEGDSDGDAYTICDGDCDDDDALTYPGAAEQCDGVDNDCDDLLPGDEEDLDGDGYLSCGLDCDDADATVFDGAPELCDGIDNDCDGTVDEDADEDLDGDGYNACQGDCDNEDATVHPGAPEQCNGTDDDCDGTLPADEEDLDADGWMVCGGDCDDADADANPADEDGDGWSTCDEPPDCADDNDGVFPGTDEDCHDGLDNDCDGLADADDPDCAGDDDDDDDDDDDSSDDDDDDGDDDDASDDDDSSGEGGCECRAGADQPFPGVVTGLLLLLGGAGLRRRGRPLQN